MRKQHFKNLFVNKEKVTAVQINLGNRCNQSCMHCHIEAGPGGGNCMDAGTARQIIAALLKSDIPAVEFTGGAPELNPQLKFFIEKLAAENRQLTVRTNLTILDNAEYAAYPDFYKQYNVVLVASLPCYLAENVDRQRGSGVFRKSIAVLKKLNSLGYGTNGLILDLVYNPGEDYLPPSQPQLEKEYKSFLQETYGIAFNRLLTITNIPLGRFRKHLEAQQRFEQYMELLRVQHNPATIDRVMCRSLISVDWRGYVYDCDFNLALDKKISGYEHHRFWEIDLSDFCPAVTFDEHCHACTAGSGSSCHGALVSGQKGNAVSDSLPLS